jgi:formylglycine-generating enzyme required for sulfatase activity
MRATLRLVMGATALLVAAFPAAHQLNKAGAMSAMAPVERPDLVEILPGSFAYRLSGDFSRGGRPAKAPLVRHRLEGTLEMMAHQVTVGEYQRCVAAGACEKLAADAEQRGDFPVVQVSFQDATAYAAWLSNSTGEIYRLPTDEEWAYAAGSRFKDDAPAQADDSSDPSKAWLSTYEQESEGTDRFDDRVRPVGGFGANEKGLLDLSGNVWEWTNTCFERQTVDQEGRQSTVANCGVRVVEGQHRGYVPDFIRDARGGGCAAGKPPSHLGFRLIRERVAKVRSADGA